MNSYHEVVQPQEQSFYLNNHKYGIFLCNNIVLLSLPAEGEKCPPKKDFKKIEEEAKTQHIYGIIPTYSREEQLAKMASSLTSS